MSHTRGRVFQSQEKVHTPQQRSVQQKRDASDTEQPDDIGHTGTLFAC